MKSWHLFIVGSALLATAGCRSDPAIPILERQLRLKEDEIYRLRATLDDLQDCPTSYPVRDGDSRSKERDDDAPRRRRGNDAPNDMQPPKIDTGSKASSVPPALLQGTENPPAGNPSKSPRQNDPAPDPTGSDGPSLDRNSDEVGARPRNIMPAGASASAVPLTPSGDSRRVAGIALNRTLTGGVNSGDRDGDQGLLVVVEPHDRAGRLVDAPAEMSVVVIDEAQKGAAARVARWDFTAAETAAMFRRTGSNTAIHLTTTWPADPPVHNKLRLFVRYVTADGRKLQTDAPIKVALPGDKIARWSPNDPPSKPEPAVVQRDTAPTTRVPGPSPQTATRSNPPKPARPVWSPERK
jgi:hypothetical protein